MTGPNRDWDKEMAEIDKIIAKQPAAPAGKPVPAGAVRSRRRPAPRCRRRPGAVAPS